MYFIRLTYQVFCILRLPLLQTSACALFSFVDFQTYRDLSRSPENNSAKWLQAQPPASFNVKNR